MYSKKGDMTASINHNSLWQVGVVCMFLVNKEAGNPTGACAEVLVRTPAGKVHTPVMKMELHIASSMGKIKASIATLCVEVGREKGGRRWGGKKRNMGEENGRTRFQSKGLPSCELLQ